MNLTELNKADARLRREHAEMLSVLRECHDLFAKDHAIDRFDWGESPLRAQDIRELNELPGKIYRVLKAVETADPLPDGGAPFDAAVDRVIAYVDGRLKGNR